MYKPPTFCHQYSYHLYTWVGRDNMGQSFFSKEMTKPQTTDLKILDKLVQCADHYTLHHGVPVKNGDIDTII